MAQRISFFLLRTEEGFGKGRREYPSIRDECNGLERRWIDRWIDKWMLRDMVIAHGIISFVSLGKLSTHTDFAVEIQVSCFPG